MTVIDRACPLITYMYYDHSTCMHYGHSTCIRDMPQLGFRSPFKTLTGALDIIFQAASIEISFRASILLRNTVLESKTPQNWR